MTRNLDPAGLTDRDAAFGIPALSGPQRQGDVLILPAAPAATTPVPASGTVVVDGQNLGNSHVIYAVGGTVYCDIVAPRGEDLRVATLTVPNGSTAYLAHPEHAYLGVAAGSYQIRLQRQHAGSTSAD